MEETQKSSGGFMSVDPAAAVQQNRLIIDQIRQTVEQAPQQVQQQLQHVPSGLDSHPGE